MSLTISGTSMFMFAIFKIVMGALTLYQGKVTHKVFKPILKEYKEAERGITNGIVMNKRRSKYMKMLKKKLLKIICLMSLVGFLSFMYAKNFQFDMVDQYIDQKYDFINAHRN